MPLLVPAGRFPREKARLEDGRCPGPGANGHGEGIARGWAGRVGASPNRAPTPTRSLVEVAPQETDGRSAAQPRPGAVQGAAPGHRFSGGRGDPPEHGADTDHAVETRRCRPDRRVSAVPLASPWTAGRVGPRPSRRDGSGTPGGHRGAGVGLRPGRSVSGGETARTRPLRLAGAVRGTLGRCSPQSGGTRESLRHRDRAGNVGTRTSRVRLTTVEADRTTAPPCRGGRGFPRRPSRRDAWALG